MSASMAPLAPPAGSIMPSSPAFGSVVGLPSLSSAQPGGMGLPSRAATMSLPRATSERLRSITMGGASRRGNAAAIGLVPKSARLPPHIGMAAGRIAEGEPDEARLARSARRGRRPRRNGCCWSPRRRPRRAGARARSPRAPRARRPRTRARRPRPPGTRRRARAPPSARPSPWPGRSSRARSTAGCARRRGTGCRRARRRRAPRPSRPPWRAWRPIARARARMRSSSRAGAKRSVMWGRARACGAASG